MEEKLFSNLGSRTGALLEKLCPHWPWTRSFVAVMEVCWSCLPRTWSRCSVDDLSAFLPLPLGFRASVSPLFYSLEREGQEFIEQLHLSSSFFHRGYFPDHCSTPIPCAAQHSTLNPTAAHCDTCLEFPVYLSVSLKVWAGHALLIFVCRTDPSM